MVIEPARGIAEKRQIPLNLVIPLISVLKSAGRVANTRGPAGKIKLVCDPAQTSLRQVVELVDGPNGITRCSLLDGPFKNAEGASAPSAQPGHAVICQVQVF
jgi:DNA-binding IscR family transcriptional regulator